MTILNAHFEGKQIVLDDTIPEDMPSNARVRVVLPAKRPSKTLEAIARLAVSVPELPRDYATNHDKYLYGRKS